MTVGNGTLAEARSAAQRVCSQLLMLGGTLDLSNDIVGNRTADVKHVAFNRTLGAGLSAKRVRARGAWGGSSTMVHRRCQRRCMKQGTTVFGHTPRHTATRASTCRVCGIRCAPSTRLPVRTHHRSATA